MARAGLIVADFTSGFEQPAARFAQDDVGGGDVPIVRIGPGEADGDAAGGDAGEPIGERGRARRGFGPEAGGRGESIDERARSRDQSAVERCEACGVDEFRRCGVAPRPSEAA